MNAALSTAHPVTLGRHDAELLAWEAAAIKPLEMAARLHCSESAVLNRLHTLRQVTGQPARKTDVRIIHMAQRAAPLDRLTAPQRAAWEAVQRHRNQKAAAQEIGCSHGALRVRLSEARRRLADVAA